MEYRKLSTGEEISVIALGGALEVREGQRAEDAIELAFEKGVNFFDFASAESASFPAYGNVLAGVRNKAYFQVHFGNVYPDGKYGWSLDLDAVKKSIDFQLKELKTDYIDFGFIHCLDEERDWETYQKNGILDYIKEMQKCGVVKKMGASTHNPLIANKILDTGLISHMMFSINPAYDYNRGDYANGSASERLNLYERCEKEGVGISVMKPFGGGTLLKADTSPFKQALTMYQCIQYCLDKPGVKTVVTGALNKEHVKGILGFFDASPEEKDYSVIASFTPADAKGRCVYCNHCQPCPAGLDVSLINKYYDLTKAGDALARDHYNNLELKASDCIACGHCNERCPFGTDQVARMKEIAEYFGK